MKLPPKGFNRVHFLLCTFRWSPWALRYGGGTKFAISYQWLGVAINIGVYNPMTDQDKKTMEGAVNTPTHTALIANSGG